MPSIKIQIEPSAGVGVADTGFVAELERLDVAKGSRRETTKVTVRPREIRVVDDLVPGRWEVRLVMPAGGTLTREVEVGGASVADAHFDLPMSGGRPKRFQDPPQPKKLLRASIPGAVASMRGLGRAAAGVTTGFQAARFGGGGRIRKNAEPKVTLLSVSPGSSAAGDASTYWAELAGTVGRRAWPSFLFAGSGQPKLRSAAVEGTSELRWSLPQPDGRAWAKVEVRSGVRLHSLPTPWRTSGPPSPVALVTERGSDGSRVAVEDETFAGLLAYLRTGSVATAADFLAADEHLSAYRSQGAVDVLRDKRASPLGACAAGYALLGSSRPGQEATWHAWIENLARWFDWLPDGAILLARLRLTQARTDEEIEAVAPVLLSALGRGLPFYRQGFDWLAQALLYFDGDPMMTDLRRTVQDVASALDMGQVFTTFQLERGAP